MGQDKQYREDSTRLAVLIEKYTNIPQDRVYQFVMKNTAEMLLPYANQICKTEAQRQKLSALFEFKNLYEIVKGADNNRVYQFTCPNETKEYFKNYFADVRDKEYFAVAYLDTKNQVIKTEKMSAGTVTHAHVHPREIFKEALFLNATAVMLAHNHPSGDTEPSKHDIEVTVRVKQGMELMGLKLHYHIIVGGNQAISLAEIGKIPVTQTQEIKMAAMPLGENMKGYGQTAKPPSIRQQLSFAEEQLSRESRVTAPPRKTHDWGDR